MGYGYGDRVVVPQNFEHGIEEERGMVLDSSDDGLVLIHVDAEYLLNNEDTGLRKISDFYLKKETIH